MPPSRAGELRRANTARLARALQSLMSGSLLQWAIDRDGTAAERIRADFDALLGPLRLRPRRRQGRKEREPAPRATAAKPGTLRRPEPVEGRARPSTSSGRATKTSRQWRRIAGMTRQEFLRLVAGGSLAWPAAVHAKAERDAGQPAPKSFPSGATKAVVEFISGATLAGMPERAIVEAKRCLIDGFGVMLAGATAHGSAIVREYMTSVRRREAGDGARSRARCRRPAAQAALANGASGHAMDYDDTQLSASADRVFGLLTHPTVPALAASLAVAERSASPAPCSSKRSSRDSRWNARSPKRSTPSTICADFTAREPSAPSAQRPARPSCCSWSPAATAHALGIAASMSPGIRVNFGSMTKPLHVGRAAENGVTAVELASRGFTAGDRSARRRMGILSGASAAAPISPRGSSRRWGSRHSIVKPGVSIKPYPCGSLGHPTMDAMLKLVTEHDVKAEQIARVRVRAGSNILNPLRYRTAKTELEAKFCLPFMMASIVLRRRAGIREFTDEFVSRRRRCRP